MLQGTVQSIFSRAANLQFDRRLVTLHAHLTPCAPNGITLSVEATNSLLLDLQAGMSVTIEHETLSFPAISACLSLQGSQPWNPRPVISYAADMAGLLERSLAFLLPLLMNTGQSDPSAGLAQLALLADCPASSMPPHASPLLQKAWSSSRQLIQAIGQQQITRAARAAETLIGLGPGLTPSGDDLLTGLIATTILLSEALALPGDFYRQFGSAVLALAKDKTTHLSLHWIEYATRGAVSEPLGRLLQALVVSDQPQQLEARANEVLSTGATSGGDLLAGVMLGSHCLLTQHKREGYTHGLHSQ
ncbi:MAG TPA: DUF2877 domain-containing protein [Ktedonobacterales bacterium]